MRIRSAVGGAWARGVAYAWSRATTASKKSVGCHRTTRTVFLFAAISSFAFPVVSMITSGAAGVQAATTEPGFSSNVITDASLVLTEASVSKPAYLSPITPAPFGLPVTRIGGDAGKSFTALNGSGTWGTDVRQHYNDDQAWNADGSLIAIQNEGSGASPSLVFLDGNTYQPKYVKCRSYSNSDDRWHPSTAHKNERINVRGTTVEWFDVVNCQQTRVWTLPFAADNDLAQNPSSDGRFMALYDNSRIFVVDMDPQAPLASYTSGNKRIGPAYNFSNCGLSDCSVDFAEITPSGKYVVITYTGDHPRVFDVDPKTLAITPHAIPAGAPQCSSHNPALGYIYDTGHQGVAFNPFDNNEEVMIGQRRSWCPRTVNGVAMGSVVMVRLKDGLVTSLTDPENEASSYHISTVNSNRPGWAYVSYWPGAGKRFGDEIIAVKMDGSKVVQRFAHTHTDTNSCYRCESHPVPSRDGTRIMFASSWIVNCGSGCGSKSNPQAYIVDARGTSRQTLANIPTNTPVATNTAAPTNTPVPTKTPAVSNTPAATNTPLPTHTPVPTSTPTLPVPGPGNPLPSPTGSGVITYAADSFGRNNTNGWGSANVGGAYALSGGSLSYFGANGSAGTISDTKGGSRVAALPGVSLRDVDITLRLQTSKMAVGDSQYVDILARREQGVAEYRVHQYLGQVRFTAQGTIGLRAIQSDASLNTSLGKEALVPGLTYSTSSFVRVRLQVVGANPTTIRMKAWADGQAEPSAWQYSTSNSDSHLQTSGGVGVRTYVPWSSAISPVLFSFDDLQVTGPH